MADYRSNKTCEEIDAILDNAVLQGSAEDTADTNTMAGLRKYVAEQSASSLIMAGTITSAFTILDGVTVGAVVSITREFAQKYKVDTITKRRFVIVDKRVAPEEGDTLYIYPQNYPGCYFVMGDFKGNKDIFGLGASTNDWIISQGREWVKIATTKRDIAGIEGDVTAEALVKRLSTQSSDNANPVATKNDIKGMVKSVTVNNTTYYSDAKGNVSLPKIPMEVDIANMGFTKNEGTVTGVMVNGESKSPNSAGVVDLGEIEVDEVKFANDLTGVVEATPEMFTYRPSAGDKSVRDESAVIRRIKGNTSVWGQTIRGLNIDSSVKVEKEGDAWVITPMGNADSPGSAGWYSGWATFNNQHSLNTNHIYLCCVTFTKISKRTDLEDFVVGRTLLSMRGKYIYLDADLGQRTTAVLISKPGASGEIFLSLNGCVTKIENPMLFDLTAIFGAGNEPTTYEEFRQCYPDVYYPYCVPEVRAMRATGIETVGFNQWDEQWENGTFNAETGENISNNQIRCKNLIRIFPNTYYSLSIGDKNLGIWAMFYDENLNILQPVNLNSSVSRNCLHISPSRDGNVFLTPENASWMKFYIPAEYGSTTYKGDICINLSHSGVRNGEYKPYEKNTLLLPEIDKYFPNGMHAIGDVCDEINDDFAIQRCATRAYESGDESNAEVMTDNVTTVYKLAEPIYTPIDEILQLDYKVDDFGTERMLSNAPSAPFKADIVYQFNAEGRIRDNSRNIEKLEELIKQPSDWLEGNPNSPAYIKNKPTLPTQVATATEVIVEYGIPAQMLPNVVYESAKSIENFTFPQLVPGEENVRNVWKLIAYMAPGTVISYPLTIKWRDGIPPTIDVAAFVELTFTSMTMQNDILGEWKLYK